LTQNLGGSQTFTPTTTFSQFAKADYAYNGKYLLSATVRRDGSSKFLEPNKQSTFPAFSAGWRISDENFMNGIQFINDLKIRGSWGKMGNEAAASATNSLQVFQVIVKVPGMIFLAHKIIPRKVSIYPFWVTHLVNGKKVLLLI
jgi:hypothetical protein